MTAPVTHPLALAQARCHPWVDAILSSQRQGETLDARVAALSGLASTGDDAWIEIQSLLADLGNALRAVTGGESNQLMAWERGATAAIRDAATRLFPDEQWPDDIRVSAWRPL